MIKFYYTNSSGAQTDPSISIGGHISTSEIPDEYLNNLFTDVTLKDIGDKTKQCRCIALKNTGPDIANLKLYYEYLPESQAKIEIGLAHTTASECGPYFELPVGQGILPRFVKFYDADVNFESAIIDINIPPTKGQTVNIYDGSLLIYSIPFTLNSQVDKYLDYIVSKFSNENYKIEKVLLEDAERQVLKITKLLLGVEEGGIISTKINIVNIAPAVPLLGLIDNSIEVEDFKSGTYLGLFIKRIIENNETILSSDLIETGVRFYFEY